VRLAYGIAVPVVRLAHSIILVVYLASGKIPVVRLTRDKIFAVRLAHGETPVVRNIFMIFMEQVNLFFLYSLKLIKN
jgi:hypothetical protein